ncbi:sulfatase [Pelagicoccus mobilis]|uniref:Sulfatase n=1 Tax=Pelagicoccus mobilis TaxID=415221 RepID=A0A934VSI0_9BACT|nr:sulfatase [Pelagicoccus mobilis]MBK1878693.1 sulfatase [Pelagicoccus mobilis]
MMRLLLFFTLHTLHCTLHLVASGEKPNFVFILVDDLGWTGTSVALHEQLDFSQSDYYQTPSIAQLAEQGMRFSHAYSPAPLCTPSRASILTGKSPAELHITSPGRSNPQAYHKLVEVENRTELKTSEITIAELLNQNGYKTAHFGKWHLGRSNPGKHGFDVHDGSTSNSDSENTNGNNPKDIFGVTSRAIDFIEKQAEANTPFYLQLSHYAVHSPTEARRESIQRFNSVAKGKRHKDAEFAAMTWDLDQSIGALLAKIRELDLTSTTYIIFASDNGAAGNRRASQNLPLNGGKGSLLEGGIRVPLIVSGPGIEGKSNSQVPTIGYDLYPTIAELAGVSFNHEIAGTSLVSVLQDSATTLDRQGDALYFHYPHYGRGPRQKPQSAIISGRYKLLKDWETGSLELYDLDRDISESKDLSRSNPDLRDKLSKQLNDWLLQVNAQLPEANPHYDADANPRSNRRRR